MKKRIAISLLLALCCLCCAFALSIAEVERVKWNDAKDHNRWTQEMIFGSQSYTYAKPEEIRLRVEQLQDALLICIDQFNGSYRTKLENLKFIQGVPSDISTIDFTAGNSKEETSHRAYTHRGWNHDYSKFEIEKSHPDIRKQILRSVVNYVFQFNKYGTTQQSDKICDAMCCLLYNTHIIEDRYHSKTYYGAVSTLLLADASPQTETVTHDLIACLPDLFPRQREERDAGYRELISGIQRIEGNIISERRNVNSKDEYLLIDRKYSVELKTILAEYVPKLLQKQAWFTQVFPINWASN